MRTRYNVAASLAGNFWAALVQIAFIPVYIKYLGVEAFGLIGAYASLQALLFLLDLGFTQALVREMARFMGGAITGTDAGNQLRTVEVIFLALGLLMLCLVGAVASWFAAHWLNVDGLSLQSVALATYIFGFIFLFRWLAGLYRRVIAGLQQTVWLSACGAVFDSLRGCGAILVLIFVSATIEAFLAFQAAVAFVEMIVLFRKAWGLLPSPVNPKFCYEALRRNWRFSGGFVLLSLIVVLLIHSDRILLSRILSLQQFGYYALASTVAGTLTLLIAPVGSVAYPRLAELVARGNPARLSLSYHRFAHLVILLTAPWAIVLALFADHLLMLWTGNPTTTSEVGPLISPLAMSYMFAGFMSVPGNLLLAQGRARPMLALYGALFLVFVPAVYFSATAYGAVPAAYASMTVSAVWSMIVLPLALGKQLPARSRRGRADDISTVVAALAGAYVVHLLAPGMDVSRVASSFWVVSIALLCAFGSSLAASSLGRELAYRGWLRCVRTWELY